MCEGVVGVAHAGVEVSFPSRRHAHFCFRVLNLPWRASSCLIWPLPYDFKNAESARTIHQKNLGPPAGAPGHDMCVFNNACQQKYPSGLKNPCLFKGSRDGGSKASNFAPRRLDLHNLITLAELTSRTPSGAVPAAKLGRSWASSGALLAPRSPLRWSSSGQVRLHWLRSQT